MTNEEKLALLEEAMDVETGSLTADLELKSLKKWNSMARLSLIVLMDDEFDKTLSSDQVRAFETVGDILAFMG